MFAKNVGQFDRIARIVLGLLLLTGAALGYGLWMWIGVIPLLTGLMSTCPLYSIFGLSTCPIKKT